MVMFELHNYQQANMLQISCVGDFFLIDLCITQYSYEEEEGLDTLCRVNQSVYI